MSSISGLKKYTQLRQSISVDAVLRLGRPALFYGVTATLLMLIGVPVVFFLWASFWSEPPGLGGHFTLQGYQAVFTPGVYQTISNTLIVAFFGTTISLIVGVGIAILAAKTDFPGGKFVGLILIIHYLVPSFITAMAWSFYISKNTGINYLLMQTPFFDSPVIDINTVWGIALVGGLHYAGLVYLLVNASASTIPRTLEESGFVEGANTVTILRRITLPLMKPAIAIAAILVFVRLIQSFGIPIILGLPGRVFVLATQMYVAVTGLLNPNYTFAGALGIIILVITLVALTIQRRVVGQHEQYETRSGEGESFENLQFELGIYARPIVFGVYAFVLLFYALPLVPLFTLSIQEQAYGVLFLDSGYSFEHYVSLFVGVRSDFFWRTFINTLQIAAVGGLVGMLVASVTSYVIIKTDSKLGTLLDYLSFAPAAIPGIITGIAYLTIVIAYNPIGLDGTIWIIMFALVAQFMVYAVRATNTGFRSIGQGLEEAAEVAGANPNRCAMRRRYRT
jgi:iron(III) transport system permease protein